MKTKKYIICGVPRAGKSTLARKIAKQLGCSHIPLDPLMTSFHRLYPETGITLSMKCDMSEYFRICQVTTQFLGTYIKALDKELDSYVIEGFHMDIDMLVKNFGETHTIVIVGYPHVTSAKKIRAIRRYDTSDIHWTYVLDQTELVKQVEWFIELSYMFYRQAERLNIQFVDTSDEYGKVIEEFLKKMESNKFDVWNIEKQRLHSLSIQSFPIHSKEIWYIKLGLNIGFEQNGKRSFLRPMLVLNKVGNLYFCLPLTTKGKNTKRYHHIKSIIFGKPSAVILSQARSIDQARFHTLISKISTEEHKIIKQKIAKLYGYL